MLVFRRGEHILDYVHLLFPQLEGLSTRHVTCIVEAATGTGATRSISCEIGDEGMVELAAAHAFSILLQIHGCLSNGTAGQ